MYSMLYVKYLNFLNPPNKGFFKFLVLHKNVEKTLTVRAGWALDKGTHTHKVKTWNQHFPFSPEGKSCLFFTFVYSGRDAD